MAIFSFEPIKAGKRWAGGLARGLVGLLLGGLVVQRSIKWHSTKQSLAFEGIPWLWYLREFAIGVWGVIVSGGRTERMASLSSSPVCGLGLKELSLALGAWELAKPWDWKGREGSAMGWYISAGYSFRMVGASLWLSVYISV